MQRAMQHQAEPQSVGHVVSSDHIDVPIMDDYCLYRERLLPETVKIIENHLAICKRCREETEDTIANADYFRRLQKAPVDC